MLTKGRAHASKGLRLLEMTKKPSRKRSYQSGIKLTTEESCGDQVSGIKCRVSVGEKV